MGSLLSTLNARRLFWDACWFCNTWGSILVVGALVDQSVVCVRCVQRSLGWGGFNQGRSRVVVLRAQSTRHGQFRQLLVPMPHSLLLRAEAEQPLQVRCSLPRVFPAWV